MRSRVFQPGLEVLNREEGTFTHREVALGRAGADTVKYYIAPDLGQPAMPLARIASGGELSHLMLALKRLAAQQRGIATMIFDEVDAEIRGAAAAVVGRKLKPRAKLHQILRVTHLTQIAVFGDRHLVVEKEEDHRSVPAYSDPPVHRIPAEARQKAHPGAQSRSNTTCSRTVMSCSFRLQMRVPREPDDDRSANWSKSL
jgi:DNA repair ATPase RecN